MISLRWNFENDDFIEVSFGPRIFGPRISLSLSLSFSLALDARPLRLGTAALSGAPPQGAVSGESAAARGRWAAGAGSEGKARESSESSSKLASVGSLF